MHPDHHAGRRASAGARLRQEQHRDRVAPPAEPRPRVAAPRPAAPAGRAVARLARQPVGGPAVPARAQRTAPPPGLGRPAGRLTEACGSCPRPRTPLSAGRAGAAIDARASVAGGRGARTISLPGGSTSGGMDSAVCQRQGAGGGAAVLGGAASAVSSSSMRPWRSARIASRAGAGWRPAAACAPSRCRAPAAPRRRCPRATWRGSWGATREHRTQPRQLGRLFVSGSGQGVRPGSGSRPSWRSKAAESK
jgi:hypothetical protein